MQITESPLNVCSFRCALVTNLCLGLFLVLGLPEIPGLLSYLTKSLGALRAPTSSWRPFGPLNFGLRALWALRLCDPRVGDWIVCQPLDSVLAVG